MKTTKVIFLVFGLLLLNTFTFAQNSERFIVQYKIDLNDSVNRESFRTKVYGYDLITDDSLRNLHFKTVEQCLFLERIRENFFDKQNFFDFYGAEGESLDETTSAYERGILPTLYLSYEAIWDEELQDFHYYPSLQNEAFPFITLELENEERKPTLSYSPPAQTNRNLIWNPEWYNRDSHEIYNYEKLSNPFDFRTIEDILTLRIFKGKISKVYNYIDKSQTTFTNQNEFDKWKANYAKSFSYVLNYDYIYTQEQLLWSQGLKVFNSDENFYYFEEGEKNFIGINYILAMDTKAPENAKFLLNGKNIFMYYFKEFVKENPDAIYGHKANTPILENINEDYIYHEIRTIHSISRNKKTLGTSIKFWTDNFYDFQKDSVFSLKYDYQNIFLDYVDSMHNFIALNFYQMNFKSHIYEYAQYDTTAVLKKVLPTSISLEDVKEFVSQKFEEHISESDKSTSFLLYANNAHIQCLYKLLPSKKKKENTLFTHKKEIIEQIIEAVKIGIIRPYVNFYTSEYTRESQEKFLENLKFLKDYFGGNIPYEKLDFHVELSLFHNKKTKNVEFYKNMYFYAEQFVYIVIPAELSPTKKEYIAFKFSIKEVDQNLVDSNPQLEFKNTISLHKILTENIFYGNLQHATLVDRRNSWQPNQTTYNLNDLENLKNQSLKLKKFIEQIPKTLTPANFE